MLKKFVYVLLTTVEIILLCSSALVNFFTKTKMGMLRHVVHKNYLLEQQYPIEIIKYISIMILILLMIIVLKLYVKRRSKVKNILFLMNLVMVLMVFGFTYFVLIYSPYEIRAFYYISVIIEIMAFIQIIKTFLFIFWHEK